MTDRRLLGVCSPLDYPRLDRPTGRPAQRRRRGREPPGTQDGKRTTRPEAQDRRRHRGPHPIPPTDTTPRGHPKLH